MTEHEIIPAASEENAPEPPQVNPDGLNADEVFLRNVNGEKIALSEFHTPPTYLTFFSPDCESCQVLVERFRWWPNATHETHDVQPVFLGTPDEFREYEAYAPLVEHAWYDDGTVARAVGYMGTPGTVAVDVDHPFGYGWIPGRKLGELYVVRPGFYDEINAELGIRKPEEED